jgi:hypothetical protein
MAADDDDVRRRRRAITIVPPPADSDDGQHAVLTPKSRFSGDLRTLVVIAMGLVAAVWGVGQYLNTIHTRLATHDMLLGLMLTKGDLEAALNREDRKKKKARATRFVVTCSREALRGRGDVTCVAVPVGDE